MEDQTRKPLTPLKSPEAYAEAALDNFYRGYNCAQSVFLAFCDVVGYGEREAEMLSSPFGAGMGRMREVCGALSGSLLVVGLVNGYTGTGGDGRKAALYREVQALFASFREKHGSCICRTLLGLAPGEEMSDPVPEKRTPEYYASRPCPGLIYDAAYLLAEYLQEKEKRTG